MVSSSVGSNQSTGGSAARSVELEPLRDPGLDQVKEDAQTDERRQADDLLTRTQSDQGQHATDADDGRSSEEAEVQRRARQRYTSARKHPRRCATGDVQCGDGKC